MKLKNRYVYFHKDLSRNTAIINPRDLYGVLTVNWLFDAAQSGIPPELVDRLYEDHQGMLITSQSGSTPLKVLYVSVEDTDEAMHLLRVISIMNAITQVSFSVYCSKQRHMEVRDVANDHISFILRNKPLRLSYDLVITFGPGILHFIRQEIPVMVAGCHGYGGIVRPENFPFLLKEGFLGRYGGAFLEKIPFEAVQRELLTIKKYGYPATDLCRLKEIAAPLDCTPVSRADMLIQKAGELRRRLYHRKERWQLKPKLASNVSVVSKNGLSYMRRTNINDTIAVADPEKFQFLNRLKGDENCASLHIRFRMEESEFWDYLHTLWDKKIIVF